MTSSPSPRTPSWSLSALARAVDAAIVLVQDDGTLGFRSDAATELLGGPEAFDAAWARVLALVQAERRAGQTDDPGDDPGVEVVVEVELPGEGGDDRGPRLLAVRAVPVDCDGEGGWLAVLQDRRAVDALQRDLQRAAQMRRTSDSMAQAHHDLKAPLSALSVNLDLVRRMAQDEADPERILPRLDVIDREVARLNRMLEVLVSQSQAPRATARRFDLRRLVREILTLVRPQARSRGIVLRVDLPDDSTIVLGARDQLKQALLNLVVNGIEAMPDGGMLEVAIASDGDDALRLTVADDGEGIPSAAEGRLFKLHFTTKREGSGIGLFTARAIVQDMGGTLQLENRAGRGARAIVRLPRPVDGARLAEVEGPCSTC